MAESIKKFIIKDAHGGTKESGSFSVVGEVHVDLVPGYGEPYADSQYVNGILTITIHNIEGNGITEITTNSQEGDEAVNTVTIKTNANPEGVTLEVCNGSRGNGIASISEVLSPDDGGVNTHTITDTDGNEHVFHTKNGRKGDKGDQGDSAVYNPDDPDTPVFEMASTTGQSTTKAMTQKAVTDALNQIDDSLIYRKYNFVANSYWNNSGSPTSTNGWARSPKLALIEELRLVADGNTIIGMLAWNGSSVLGVYSQAAISGKTSFTSEQVLASFPTATHVTINIRVNNTNTAIDQNVVSTWYVESTQTFDARLKDAEEAIGQRATKSELTEEVSNINKKFQYHIGGFLANRYYNNAGTTQTYNGWAKSPKMKLLDEIELVADGNNVYNVLAYNESTVLGSYTPSANTKIIKKSDVISRYPTATHIGLNIRANTTSTALDSDVVAGWYVKDNFTYDEKISKMQAGVAQNADEIEMLKEQIGVGVNGTFHYVATANSTSYITSGTKKLNFKVARSSTPFGDNPCFNFQSYMVNNTSVHACSDDITPMQYNNTYIGANHGDSDVRRLVCSSPHGKTYADIGSIWLKGGKEFTIVGIEDEYKLYMLGENTKEYPKFQFETVIPGTFTHSSGATHTDNIVASSYESTQLKPAYKMVDKTIYVDGKKVTESGDYDFKKLEICEAYDVMNVASLLQAIQQAVGTFESNPVFNELPGVEYVARHTLVYTFFGADLCFVNTNFTFFQDVDFSFASFVMNVIVLGNNLKMYIPKALPVGGLDFRTIANYTSLSNEINITSQYWENPLLPPDRWVQFSDSIGFAAGMLFDYGVGGEARKDYIANAFNLYTSRKCYPHGVDGSKIMPHSGDSFCAVAFRRYFPKSEINVGGVICCNTFEYDNKFYIYADYNAAGIYEIDIPSKFLGKTINVFEKSDNVTLLTKLSASKMLVKVTMGNEDVYGYIVAQIK